MTAPGERAPLATSGRRAAAFAVDAVASGLVGRLIDPIPASGPTGVGDGLVPVAVLAVVYVVGLLLVGQTLGMRLLGLRVVPADGSGPSVGLLAALLRTALLLLLVPAVISDGEGRGLHDKAARTVVVRLPERR